MFHGRSFEFLNIFKSSGHYWHISVLKSHQENGISLNKLTSEFNNANRNWKEFLLVSFMKSLLLFQGFCNVLLGFNNKRETKMKINYSFIQHFFVNFFLSLL